MIPKRDIINRIKLVLKESKEPLHKTEISKRALISLPLYKDFQAHLNYMVKKGIIKKMNIGKLVGYYID